MLIVCNGMYRSGSTLQYEIVRRLVENAGCGKGKGFVGSSDEEFYKLQSTLLEWGESEQIYVVKSHLILLEWPNVYETMTQKRIKTCYIYRDIRSVYMSVKRVFGKNSEETIVLLDRAVDEYFKMKSVPNVLYQKYEKVIGDLPTMTKEIEAYLGLKLSPKIIEKVILKCSPEEIKKFLKIHSQIVKLNKLRYTLSMDLKILKKGFKETLNDALLVLRGSNINNNIGEWHSPTVLLHSKHISDDFRDINKWKTVLSQQEIEFLSQRYHSYLLDAGYPI